MSIFNATIFPTIFPTIFQISTNHIHITGRYGMVPGGCLLSQKATSVTLKSHIAGLDVAQLTP